MRELKFRVWEKNYLDRMEMSYSPCLLESDGTPHDYNGFINLNNEIKNEFKNGNILMQYTGLKDKNGKEIYEGDIIQFPETTCGSVVKWNERSSGFYLPGLWGSTLCNISRPDRLGRLVANQITEYDVIGNIYENPELLEKLNG